MIPEAAAALSVGGNHRTAVDLHADSPSVGPRTGTARLQRGMLAMGSVLSLRKLAEVADVCIHAGVLPMLTADLGATGEVADAPVILVD